MIVLMFNITLYAQKNVPEIVKTNFKTKFTTAQKVKFSKEKDGTWEVDFKENKIEYSAKYSPAGEWLETEQTIKFKETPTAVQNFVKNNYAGFDVETCEKVNKPKTIFYEIFVEKGKQNFELLITSEGKLIEEKKAGKSENKDDDD